LRDVPFSGIYWMGYEMLKKRLNETIVMEPVGFEPEEGFVLVESPHMPMREFWISFISGATSGMVGFLFILLPFDRENN
jgi:hypothetical protein